MVKLQKAKEVIKKLPQQKAHLDFLAALLTIPVLITVLILNFNNLKTKSSLTLTPTPSATPTAAIKSIQTTVAAKPTANPSQCLSGIGQLAITSPTENQTVTNNPVCIDINYDPQKYCGVVWRYQMNGGNWSEYGNSSGCFYNLPNGQNTFFLQAKSLTSSATVTMQRTFLYQGSVPTATPAPTLAPTATATSSAGQ